MHRRLLLITRWVAARLETGRGQSEADFLEATNRRRKTRHEAEFSVFLVAGERLLKNTYLYAASYPLDWPWAVFFCPWLQPEKYHQVCDEYCGTLTE